MVDFAVSTTILPPVRVADRVLEVVEEPATAAFAGLCAVFWCVRPEVSLDCWGSLSVRDSATTVSPMATTQATYLFTY